ncbi:MAG: hypothetical protein JJE25_05840 [Bacteroidia bacterium]|nr:hypothetical protein [Bacteroidia bacterium]
MIKKIALLFLFITFWKCGISQDTLRQKWLLGVYASVEVYSLDIAVGKGGSDSPEAISFSKSLYQAQRGTTAGILLSYKKIKNINLRSGILISDWSVKTNDCTDSVFGSPSPFGNGLTFLYSYEYYDEFNYTDLNIPLGIQYKFLKGNFGELGGSLDFSASLNITATETRYFSNSSIPDERSFGKVCQFLTTLGLYYSTNGRNINFKIEPHYIRTLSSTQYTYAYKVYLDAFGLGISINFKL